MASKIKICLKIFLNNSNSVENQSEYFLFKDLQIFKGFILF